MIRSRSSFLIFVQTVLSIICIVGLVWVNQRIARIYPIGSEFAKQWAVIRSYVTQGTSPYNSEISKMAGELLEQSPDEQGLIFAQPFYAIIFILPLALISDLVVAKTVWLFILELCLIGMSVMGIRLTQWRPSLWNWFLLVVNCLVGFPAFAAAVEGDMIILVVILLGASLLALRLEWDELAGIALAFTTIMPEAILFVGIFVLVWIITKRRMRFLVWFFFTIAVLTIISLFLISDWPLQYLRVLINNSELSRGGFSTFAIFTGGWPGIGRQLAWILSIVMIIVLLIEWALASHKDFNWFIWTVCLTITATFWIGIPTRLVCFYIIIIPLILILATWDQRSPGKGHWLPIAGHLATIFGIWLMYLGRLFGGSLDAIPSTFIIVIPFFTLIGLYWIRWWCVRPQHLGMDDLKAYEALR